ncbi:hypothetical protein HI806_03355 [Ralstonia solanacearum]|uniref:hypothetical protein n=1 Tax=Ralstonia pseudosolanacearum TaxID=1310165 RepID=UPI0005788874|nr:hypothetical protein [Ralstonia pseudosolanacearum]APF85863.1 hypothetical protein BCR16_03190 [Ralstonia solanacearum FJAT-1458]ARS57215.1 hypothetical protein BC427_14460 [Ralstonia solanacearum FJAT-91]AXV68330.1 hypothetical protein CJO74_02965 [Ralstonia solanacearum]AXV94690.1 hypothetical protein CJO80_03300 [Ralstonia solanacearum]AXV99902.1 hypothetical protein CJO81_03485 [Ralstonia solanacearum]
MKSPLGAGLLAAWLVVGAWLLNDWWGTHLDLVPKPPEVFGDWLIRMTGTANAEEAGDADFLFGLVVSFVIVSMLTWLLLATLRQVRALLRRHR